MAIQRPLKEGSVRTYQEKVGLGFFDILASEMDADLDTVYAAWNGGVGTGDIQDGAVTKAKLATDANLWNDTGTALTPVGAGRRLYVPGDTATTGSVLIGGARTVKARLVAHTSADSVYFMVNRDLTAVDDATKPSWFIGLQAASDNLIVGRAPAGSGVSGANFLTLDNVGNLTYPQRTVNRSYTGALTMAANQNIAQGATVELNLDTALIVSNLNNTGFHQLIADRDGMVAMFLIVNFSAAVTGLGAGIEIQQWNNGTWGRIAAVATNSQPSLVVSGMAPCWNANYRQFRATLTNATTGSMTVSASFYMLYVGAF